jgi:hypothetical protein
MASHANETKKIRTPIKDGPPVNMENAVASCASKNMAMPLKIKPVKPT